MSRIRLHIVARYQEYGPRATCYGIASGALYTTALVITAFLRIQGLDRQIIFGRHISDLLGTSALLVAGICVFHLAWNFARTQPIETSIKASRWAVTVAARIITPAGMVFFLVLYGGQMFTEYLRHTSPSGLFAIVIAACGTLLLVLTVWALLYWSLVAMGGMVCTWGARMSHYFYRTTTIVD
jgi:hypothetical protein